MSRSVRLEGWLVLLIALHSYAIGCGLLFLPGWSLHLAGFERIEPGLFVRQAGVFHLLIATGYLLEYFRRGSVTLLLLAKASAVAFLGAMLMLEPCPWFVPAAGAADGLMGLAVWAVHRNGMFSEPR